MQITVTSASLRRNICFLTDTLRITIYCYFIYMVYISTSCPLCFICYLDFCGIWNRKFNSIIFKDSSHTVYIFINSSFWLCMDNHLITTDCIHICHFIFNSKRIGSTISLHSRIDCKLVFRNIFISCNRWFILQLLFYDYRSTNNGCLYCCRFSAECCFVLYSSAFTGGFNWFQILYVQIIYQLIILIIVFPVPGEIRNNKFPAVIYFLRVYCRFAVSCIIFPVITVFYFEFFCWIQL